MEKEFESYNKNIDELDARNIFEYDALKEINREKGNTIDEKKFEVKRIKLFKEQICKRPPLRLF